MPVYGHSVGIEIDVLDLCDAGCIATSCRANSLRHRVLIDDGSDTSHNGRLT